ncbi:MAG: helix-turn-helix transcriptional regulator [Planctomycetes bacterium]|nr:helix-turn-helix transcriptional regulator [Planctomycetota bacterium]
MAKRVKRDVNAPCLVGEAVEVVGGRWKGDILWYLQAEPKRFMELRRLLPHITPKVLTQELRELERDGLVHREQYAEIPPRVEYSMTAVGRSALPLLEQLSEWWKKNRASVRRSAAMSEVDA